MKFEGGVGDQAVVVCVEGRVDASSAPLFEVRLKQRVAEHERKSPVLDLSRGGYLSSAGLRTTFR